MKHKQNENKEYTEEHETPRDDALEFDMLYAPWETSMYARSNKCYVKNSRGEIFYEEITHTFDKPNFRAHLIAAAPELLGTLEDLLADYFAMKEELKGLRWDKYRIPPSPKPIDDPLLLRAKSIIAKAKGES